VKDNFNVETKVTDLLNPTLKAMGYRLVRVRMAGSQNKTMQVMAERVDEVNMTVEDCALISREVSNILDVANPVEDAYSLEISSPGIDRPLVCPSDYDRYSGFDAKIEMVNTINGRKRFKGQLLGMKNNLVRICIEEGTAELPFEDIRRAKLTLSDEMFVVATKSAEG